MLIWKLSIQNYIYIVVHCQKATSLFAWHKSCTPWRGGPTLWRVQGAAGWSTLHKTPVHMLCNGVSSPWVQTPYDSRDSAWSWHLGPSTQGELIQWSHLGGIPLLPLLVQLQIASPHQHSEQSPYQRSLPLVSLTKMSLWFLLPGVLPSFSLFFHCCGVFYSKSGILAQGYCPTPSKGQASISRNICHKIHPHMLCNGALYQLEQIPSCTRHRSTSINARFQVLYIYIYIYIYISRG